MAIDSVVIALIWAAVAVYGISTMRTVATHALEQRAPVKPDAPVDVPEDLLALAMQENEAWAQEELLRVIRERYELYHDWNRVRSAMGIGRLA